MSKTAEAVSATLTTNRNCTIEITNVSAIYILNNPKVYMESGFNQHPPQPTVGMGMTEVCSFTKDDNTATGAVGLLTYDLFSMQTRSSTQRIALMFSVPFDYNVYSNQLAVSLVGVDRACDKKLYKHLYEEKEQSDFVRAKADGSGLLHTVHQVDVRATMSDGGKAIFKVELYDKMGR